MQIKRNFYLQQLIDGKQNGLIKIIKELDDVESHTYSSHSFGST